MKETPEQKAEDTNTPENVEKVRVKCLLIDDHTRMIKALNEYFSDFDNFVAVECHSVEDALNAIRANSPKVLFLDNSLTLGGNEGLEIAEKAREIDPDMKIYSTTTNDSLIKSYETQGIGHIDKTDTKTMRAIISGE